jgi:hypothetical protein
MMRGASGDECGNLLGQEYNRPAREAGVFKKPQEATLPLPLTLDKGHQILYMSVCLCVWGGEAPPSYKSRNNSRNRSLINININN